MQKLNSNAFAISTLLYGLLIISVLVIFMIISLSAFSKKTTNDFVEQTEKELLEFANSRNNSICS